MFSYTNRKLAVLATAVIVCACSEGSAPTAPAAVTPFTPQAPVAPARLDLVGFIEVDGLGGSGTWLRIDNKFVALKGEPAGPIRGLHGAELTVRGTMDAVDGMFVETFRVLSVRGRTVMDGWLVKNGETLQLRLATGDLVNVLDAPSELESHVGKRIWLAPKTEEKPAEYGVIL
jgi:hypothetical protein